MEKRLFSIFLENKNYRQKRKEGHSHHLTRGFLKSIKTVFAVFGDYKLWGGGKGKGLGGGWGGVLNTCRHDTW